MKEAVKVHVTDAQITWYPITKSDHADYLTKQASGEQIMIKNFIVNVIKN